VRRAGLLVVLPVGEREEGLGSLVDLSGWNCAMVVVVVVVVVVEDCGTVRWWWKIVGLCDGGGGMELCGRWVGGRVWSCAMVIVKRRTLSPHLFPQLELLVARISNHRFTDALSVNRVFAPAYVGVSNGIPSVWQLRQFISDPAVTSYSLKWKQSSRLPGIVTDTVVGCIGVCFVRVVFASCVCLVGVVCAWRMMGGRSVCLLVDAWWVRCVRAPTCLHVRNVPRLRASLRNPLLSLTTLPSRVWVRTCAQFPRSLLTVISDGCPIFWTIQPNAQLVDELFLAKCGDIDPVWSLVPAVTDHNQAEYTASVSFSLPAYNATAGGGPISSSNPRELYFSFLNVDNRFSEISLTKFGESSASLLVCALLSVVTLAVCTLLLV
jgi:hypothetical protein